MKCWKCERGPSGTNPLLFLRLNDMTHSEYCCLPCAFELGGQEAQRRSRDELNFNPKESSEE